VRVRKPDDDAPGVDMAPLIDCMFILLIFFLVTATLKKVENEVPLELPFADATVQRQVDPELIVLAVDADGQQYVDNEPVTTAMLHELLAEAAATDPNRRVRVDGDRSAPYQGILELIEAAKVQGLNNIGLHAMNPDQGPAR
jgi:biopolymer transport protein ExbD